MEKVQRKVALLSVHTNVVVPPKLVRHENSWFD